MVGSENDGSGKQTSGNNVKKEANTHEDDINLIDYFRVLLKWRYFIVLGSVLPALIVGLVFFFSPRSYKVTYVYDVRDEVIPNIISFGANRYDNRIVADLWNGRSKPDTTVRSTLAINGTAPVFFISGINLPQSKVP